MDITKAKRVVELSKDNKRILLTTWESGLISSCTEEEAKQSCETCQCDDAICQEYIEHLKSQGYKATEIELGGLESEESLPRFLQQKGASLTELKEEGDANIETNKTLPGSSGELQPGEPGSGSTETD